uniref:glutaminase n=1 Tax=Dugesia japonica TaxID=6161 RepID=B1Q3K1_DUGJA|nr:glutaminase [Dugesia japonica]
MFRNRNFSNSVIPNKNWKYLIDIDSPEINLNDVKNVIQNSGIPFTDFRIKECINALVEESNDLIVRRDKFLQLLEGKDFHILNKILTDNLAIPNFKNFSEHIKDIYNHCVHNQNGRCCYIYSSTVRIQSSLLGGYHCVPVDGQRFNIGDSTVNFCLQSTSKPINYALALTEIGSYNLHKFVGYEPSGTSFNHLTLNHENKPHNPMINSGAILICSLIKQHLNLPERFDYIFRQFKKICGNEVLGFNNAVFMSEKSSADRNYALAYYMREYRCFPKNSNLQEILDLYFQLCSLEVNCESMSVIASTFANGGLCPTTEEKVLSSESVRDTLSLMHSCGMYDYSGQFAFKKNEIIPQML